MSALPPAAHGRLARPWWALGLCGLAFLVVGLAVWPLPAIAHLDFEPSPDAPEYLGGGIALARDGTHHIEIAGQSLPSRYPPGFPAVIAVWIRLGVDALRAPFVASAVAAVLLLALVGFAARRRSGWPGAACAVVLLATMPGFLALARAPMSEATSVAATTAGGLAIAAYARGARLRVGMAGALLLGLATVLRVGNVFLFPFAASAWWLARRERRVPWGHAVLLVGSLLVGTAPLLLSQWWTFGHPLANGYAFWVPGSDTLLATLGWQNVVDNAGYLLREVLQLEWKTTVASSYGSGEYLGPAGFVLLTWAVCEASRDRRDRWLLLGLLPFAAAMLAYAFHDARFFAPLVPFAVVVAGGVVAEAASRGGALPRAAAVGLLALHALGVPGRGWTPTSLALLAGPPPTPAPHWAALTAIATEAPGLVLVTGNPVHAKAVLGDGWLVAPANDDHDYRWHPQRWRFGRSERAVAVAAAVGAGRPVYLATGERMDLAAAIDVPVGWGWRPLRPGREGGVLRLEAR